MSKKEFSFCIIIFIIYLLIIITLGFNHEPWGDEAQAWLIARDYSIYDLIFNELKYEGHPILWYALLKTIISILPFESHIIYNWIFLIPISLSSIGIYLLLFKSKLPIILKILIPFSFYFCYQYAIIARNHSLALPIIATIAIFYKHRLKHPFIYSLLLIIFSNISAYTFILTGVLSIFFLYDLYKDIGSKNIIKNIKSYLPAILVFIILLLTMLYMQKPEDCIYIASLHPSTFSLTKVFNIFQDVYYNKSTIGLYILQLIIIFALYFSLFKILCKNTYDKLFFLSLNLVLPFVLSIFYYTDWHLGYILCALIFSFWVLCEQNGFKIENKIIKIIFYTSTILIFMNQLCWTTKCSIFEMRENYSCAKEVVQYLKDNNLLRYSINGFGFRTISLQPYFEHNIYRNYTECNHYPWKASRYRNIYEKFIGTDIIIADHEERKDLQVINGLLDRYYNKKTFYGGIYSKGQLRKENILYVYVNKRITLDN